MADPIRFVDSSTPLTSIVKERPSTKREKQPQTPRDAVSLSHPNNQRTLKLLQQILADALGHRGISLNAKNASAPEDVTQVSAFLLDQINTVLIEPYLAMTPDLNAEDFTTYVERFADRLKAGKMEAKAVFQALELGSESHLSFVDVVSKSLDEALTQLIDGARLKLSM